MFGLVRVRSRFQRTFFESLGWVNTEAEACINKQTQAMKSDSTRARRAQSMKTNY